MTALDLIPDNKAIILDSSTLAKLGRMGSDQEAFLNVLFASNREVYVHATVVAELIAAGPEAVGSRRAVTWVQQNLEEGNLRLVGKVPADFAPHTDAGERSIRSYVLDHPGIDFIIVTDDGVAVGDPNLLGDFGNADASASLTIHFLKDLFLSGGMTVFDFGRALIEAAELPTRSKLAQIADIAKEYAWIGSLAQGERIEVTNTTTGVTYELELLANGSLRVYTSKGTQTIAADERFRVDAGGNVIRDPATVAEELDKTFCFPGETLISTPCGALQIKDIRPGDTVLAFDPGAEAGRGKLVPARVVRLFAGETDEWIRLSWSDADETRSITVTPGHRFLDACGGFRRIDEICEDDTPQIVLESGTLVDISAERIVWSAQTASLYEASISLPRAVGDGLSARPGAAAWQTYNFEVALLHTYVAGGVRVHNDSQSTIDLAGSLARTFGTQLGQLMTADQSQFVQLAAGTLLGAVTENLAEVIADIGIHAFDGKTGQWDVKGAAQDSMRQLKGANGQSFSAEVVQAATTSVASLMVAELGEKLGLDGFGADLFQLSASHYAGKVLYQVANNVASSGDAFHGVNWVDAWDGLGTTAGGFFGAAAARHLLPAESIEGSIGGSLGSVAGTSIAVNYLASHAVSAISAVLIPGIGAFVGTLIGTFLGNLFGDDPDPGTLMHIFSGQQDPGTGPVGGATDPLGYQVYGIGTASDGFPSSSTNDMIKAAQNLTVGYLRALGAAEIANAHVDDLALSSGMRKATGWSETPLVRLLQSMSVDAGGSSPKFYVNGVRVASAEEMVSRAAAQFLHEAQAIGGDILAKRAAANSTATDVVTLTADLAAAEEFRHYLEDRVAINSFIKSAPDTVFSATWAIAIAQAQGLKLSALNVTDFNGGLNGFLASLSQEGLTIDPSDVTLSRDASNHILLNLKTEMSDAVPDTIGAYAHASQIIEGGAQDTLRLTFNSNMSAVGYKTLTGRETVKAGVWNVTGESTGRDLWIAPDNASYRFTDIGTHTIKAGQAEIESSDDIIVGRGGRLDVQAGTGWDWVIGSSVGDSIHGGAQDDTLLGGGGNDTIDGGAGRDYVEGGAGADTLRGGGVDGQSDDALGYSGSNAAVKINLATGTASGGHATGDVFSAFLDVVGSDYNDTLIGNEKGNYLEGGPGADTIDGGHDGAKLFFDLASYARAAAGVTASLLYPSKNTGEAKGDVYLRIEGLIGSEHNDLLFGNSASNQLIGRSGDDILVAGAGADELYGGFGLDVMSYRLASAAVKIDLTTWSASSDLVKDDKHFDIEAFEGTNHNDTLLGSAGGDILIGYFGADRLEGRAGGDALEGGDGNDTLLGQVGDDILNGGSGNDVLIGGTGRDHLIGGSGTDRADYSAATAAVRVDLAAPRNSTGEAKGDTFDSVENALGSGYADNLRGDIGKNVLWGRAGNDSLYGREGNDTLLGGAGADRLDGGVGTDRAQYSEATAGVIADLASSAANSGEAAGDTYVSIENLYGSNYNDALRGDALANTFWGSDGNDDIRGRQGNDTLNGGAGADDFYFSRNWDRDVVVDFTDDVDEIILHSSLGVSTVAQAMSRATKVGSDFVFDFGQDDVLTVRNATYDDLVDDIRFF